MEVAGLPCNLCSSSAAEEIRTRDRHGQYLRSVICRRCGLVWTDPRPTPQEMRAFYEHEYRLSYKRTYQPKRRHVYRSGKVAVYRCLRLRPLLRPGSRVLDVGAGGGEVVYVLRAMGYDASGFEPNEGYARYAVERLGAPVTQGFWQDVPIAHESQDGITMFHTLEHLEDPAGVVRKAYEWLAPEGRLLIEVPNVEATYNQPHQQFHPGHLHHFNMAVLQTLGRAAGFTVIGESTSEDGGIITAVFEKSGPPSPVSLEIPGNYERVSSVLRRHTTLTHVFSQYPYVRPLRKLRTRIEELWKTRRPLPPAQVLDDLIRRMA